MGYFANAIEAEIWQSRHCTNCIFYFDGQCPVLHAHWIWGSEDCNKKTSRLHDMIVHLDDGTNGECFGFYEDAEAALDPRRTEDYRAKKWKEVMGTKKHEEETI